MTSAVLFLGKDSTNFITLTENLFVRSSNSLLSIPAPFPNFHSAISNHQSAMLLSFRNPQFAIRNASHQSAMLLTNPLSVNASLFPQSEIRDPQFLSYRLLFTAFPQSEIAVPGLASFIICGNYFASVSPIQDKRDLYWIETL